jgi:hypothetical protein
MRAWHSGSVVAGGQADTAHKRGPRVTLVGARQRKRFSLERRPSGLAVIEEGQIGVSDLAVFYQADHQIALAVVHFLSAPTRAKYPARLDDARGPMPASACQPPKKLMRRN